MKAPGQKPSPLISEKLLAVKQRVGREIRVFETSAASVIPNAVAASEEPDDFYEFTADDYYRALATTKKKDETLKTRKTREAEQAARRSRFTKATIRVRFPDNCTLEAIFQPSDTIQSLVDLLKQVVAQPEKPFYLYTTPPKKQLKDMSQDFFSAGFIPGAIVYFSYDVSKGEDGALESGPFLDEEILALKGLQLNTGEEPVDDATEESSDVAAASSSPAVPQIRAPNKKPTKPKWLKF